MLQFTRNALYVVDHGILLSKLNPSGLDDNTITWFESYLFGNTFLLGDFR